MAKKYKNYTVSNDISKENDSYTTWTNDVLRKVIAIFLKEKMDVYSGAVVFAEEGDYIRVNNTHEQENLTYIRVFDRDGWRQGS